MDETIVCSVLLDIFVYNFEIKRLYPCFYRGINYRYEFGCVLIKVDYQLSFRHNCCSLSSNESHFVRLYETL